MLTVQEAVKSATDYLEKKKIKSARLNSELLLCNVLKCNRLDLYLNFDKPLQKNDIDFYRELISRRSKFEPLQYILGRVEFFGLKFDVNPSVLIPRPETELLVEAVIDSQKAVEGPKILDVGSGSGNISIALAKKLPTSKIFGIEVSEDAIAVSRKNAKFHHVEDQVLFVNKNLFDGIDISIAHYDVIVSNPPYVSSHDYLNLDPELRLFEPKISLTDGADGLRYYKKISSLAKSLLKKDGMIFFEIGILQAESVKAILHENGFKNIVIKKDYSDIERIIFGVIN